MGRAAVPETGRTLRVGACRCPTRPLTYAVAAERYLTGAGVAQCARPRVTEASIPAVSRADPAVTLPCAQDAFRIAAGQDLRKTCVGRHASGAGGNAPKRGGSTASARPTVPSGPLS